MIANYLKEYFKASGIVQEQISKATGIDQSKICLSLNGKRKISAEELLLIAKVYDIDLNKLKETIVQ